MESLPPTQLLGRIPRNDVLAYKCTVVWYRIVNFMRRINNDTLHLLENDTMSPLAVSSLMIVTKQRRVGNSLTKIHNRVKDSQRD